MCNYLLFFGREKIINIRPQFDDEFRFFVLLVPEIIYFIRKTHFIQIVTFASINSVKLKY